jgi:hypothetical protein
MEPSRCSYWQLAANRPPVETAETSQICCRGCDWLPRSLNGKEGVDGSSPSEGSSKKKIPGNRGFLLSNTAPQSTSAFRVGRAIELAARLQSPCKIDLLPGTSEHLPYREGLDEVAVLGHHETRWKRGNEATPRAGMPNLGDRFWGELARLRCVPTTRDCSLRPFLFSTSFVVTRAREGVRAAVE